jgi:hypothetical protein
MIIVAFQEKRGVVGDYYDDKKEKVEISRPLGHAG